MANNSAIEKDKLSSYQRLVLVCNGIPAETEEDVEYDSARAAFLAAIRWPLNQWIPGFLIDPTGFFYYKKRPAGVVCLTSFPFNDRPSTRITSRTFPSFLRFHGIPEGPSKERNALLAALTNLLKKQKYSVRETLLTQLKATDVHATNFLVHKVIVDGEKNLFFDPSSKRAPFVPIALTSHYNVFKKRKALTNRYLSEIIHEPTDTENRSYWPPRLPTKTLLYYRRSNATQFQAVGWDTALASKQYDTDCPVKALLCCDRPAAVPANAAAWLFHMTGGELELLDRFARRLACAASPNPCSRNATVICTRHNAQALIHILTLVYGPLLCSYNGKIRDSADLPLPTFNQLSTPNRLADLYLQQATGKGVCLVRDFPVSDTAKPVVNKLLRGNRIQIEIPYFPKQNLHSRIHFFCISQDYDRALKLSRNLKAELLDFSAAELPASELPALSAEDIAWLRMVLLPYGLTEREPKPKKRTPAKHPDWVEEFLHGYCEIEPGACFDRHDIYDAYCQCYRYLHPGTEPPLTEGRFVKAAKQMLGKGTLSNVEYRKVRSRQRWYFVGLMPYIPANPDHDPVPPPIDSFTAHLQAIHDAASFKISLPPGMKVGVSSLPSCKDE